MSLFAMSFPFRVHIIYPGRLQKLHSPLKNICWFYKYLRVMSMQAKGEKPHYKEFRADTKITVVGEETRQ
jgi:hypothetical protein